MGEGVIIDGVSSPLDRQVDGALDRPPGAAPRSGRGFSPGQSNVGSRIGLRCPACAPAGRASTLQVLGPGAVFLLVAVRPFLVCITVLRLAVSLRLVWVWEASVSRPILNLQHTTGHHPGMGGTTLGWCLRGWEAAIGRRRALQAAAQN